MMGVPNFTREYLQQCKTITPDQILEFLDNYRSMLSEASEKCQLISIKIEPSLLQAFKQKAALDSISYQTQMKKLMKLWVMSGSVS